jgi:para-nitrobenzyl esterase
LAGDVLRLYPAGSDPEAVRSAGDLADDLSTAAMWKWAELHVRTGGAPVFRYQFDRAVPVAPGTVVNGAPATGTDIGAVHASEIAYVFGALASKKDVSEQPEDWRLSDAMETYWTNFARTGNPNGGAMPAWPRYGPEGGYQVMHLGVSVAAAPDPNRGRYAYWDSAPVTPP